MNKSLANRLHVRDFVDGYTEGGANSVHYYISDHQGNNRVVAKSDGTIEQTMQ